VPEAKLRSRFPRTQQAIQMASGVADLTLMFDNSRDETHAFTLARAQRKNKILYEDCRYLAA
jgi:predicted ABC-type ATPase